MNTDLHFSSKKNDWRTPRYIFDYLNDIYKFTLDPCASDDNNLCDKYYTLEDDGLSKSWAGETVFMNPPYGREISKWVKKAFDETNDYGATVICLLPARTCPAWFWDYCQDGAINFLRGRVKFSGCKNSAPFPSMIVHFTKQNIMMRANSGIFTLDHKQLMNRGNSNVV
jgi:site-specific DNA-methyltransferase (adenine-specific)